MIDSNFIIEFDGKQQTNFWDQKPLLKTISPFKEFYKKDRSAKSVESSKIMWAIALKNHPNSDLYNIPEKEELISKDFLNSPKFKWGNYEELETAFINICMTQAQKSLHEWNVTMIKRDKFIKKQDFTLDEYVDNGAGKMVLVKGTADQLDKMLANTPKLYETYTKILSMLGEEDNEFNSKPESETDSGDI